MSKDAPPTLSDEMAAVASAAETAAAQAELVEMPAAPEAPLGAADPVPETPEADLAPTGAVAKTLPEAKEMTKARARDLRALLGKYVHRHLPEPAPKSKALVEPPRQVGAYARWLPVLKLIPTALILLFGFSFFWDFNGASFVFFGHTFVLDGLLRTLAVSGLIGFVTNWIAITMLFNPRERRPIFGQGVIPSQRERVIYRLAKAVSEELINEEIIKQKIEESQVIPRYRELAMSVTRGVLEDPDFRGDLKGLTAEYVNQVLGSEEVRKKIAEFAVEKIEQHLGQGLSGMALKTYRFLNEQDFQRRIDKAIQELPTSLDGALDEMDHLLDKLPEKIEARSEDLEVWATRIVLGFVEKLDVYGMIMGNMERYDERRLEELLKKTTNEQLTYIKYLGGVLGVFGGLVIWEPVFALSSFALIGGTLYLLDETLYRALKKKAA